MAWHGLSHHFLPPPYQNLPLQKSEAAMAGYAGLVSGLDSGHHFGIDSLHGYCKPARTQGSYDRVPMPEQLRRHTQISPVSIDCRLPKIWHISTRRQTIPRTIPPAFPASIISGSLNTIMLTKVSTPFTTHFQSLQNPGFAPALRVSNTSPQANGTKSGNLTPS